MIKMVDRIMNVITPISLNEGIFNCKLINLLSVTQISGIHIQLYYTNITLTNDTESSGDPLSV